VSSGLESKSALCEKIKHLMEKKEKQEKQYDNMMSALIGRNPQAFLDLLYPGSRFVKHYRNKLANTQRQPDAIIEAVRIKTGKIFLAQPEIQTNPDDEMAERLALYQVLLRWDHKQRSESETKSKVWVPVSSSVLHLTKAHEKLQVPLHWTAPGEDDEREDKALDFYFKNVEMRDKTPEEILRLDHMELLPLLPATQGGASHEVIEMMMELLLDSPNVELAYYGYLVAGLIFKFLRQLDEIEWLQRRYKTMDEKFSASPVYQWTLEEGIAIGEARGEAKGIAIGEAKGEAKGEAQANAQTLARMRQRVVEIVIEHFSSLIGLANEIVAVIHDPDSLFSLGVNLAQAQSTEEAQELLLKAQSAR